MTKARALSRPARLHRVVLEKPVFDEDSFTQHSEREELVGLNVDIVLDG